MNSVKKNILLGSLSVNYEVWLPYASGCLQSFALRDSDIATRFNFLDPLYKKNSDLSGLLPQVDILGLTCYVWNQSQNDRIAEQFKEINKQGVVLFGGPNIPKDISLQSKMAKEKPQVDLFFVGPGEEIFINYLKAYDTTPTSENPGTFGIANGLFFSCQTEERRQIALDLLPDPYNSEVFHSILEQENRVKCSIETNRGCPFKCAFCDWGGTSNNKVTKFDLNKVKKVLDYIYQKKNIAEIEILDANFGMLERDLEIVNYMHELKVIYNNHPKVSYSGLVKNGSKFLAPILKRIHFDLGAEQRNLKISFQTHSKSTLETIQRENIKNEKLLPIINELKSEGLPVTSEMIIGLPGETPESWLKSIERDYELNIDYMRTYFLLLTCNTDMYAKEYREKYSIKSKRLRFPDHFSGMKYKDVWLKTDVLPKKGYDFEEYELIYSCATFNLNEIVKMFDYWWFYHNFCNSRALKLSIDYLSKNGISLSKQIKDFYAWLPKTGFIANMIKKNRAVVEKIYSPNDVTDILDLSEYFFYSRCLRLDEVHLMLKNQGLFFTEINSFLELLIPSKDEREKLLNLQRKEWLTYSSGETQWNDVKMAYGTDARIIKDFLNDHKVLAQP